MFAIVLILLLSHNMSPACCTRLPLEVYELKSAGTTTTSTSASATTSKTSSSSASPSSGTMSTTTTTSTTIGTAAADVESLKNSLKLKNFEYTTTVEAARGPTTADVVTNRSASSSPDDAGDRLNTFDDDFVLRTNSHQLDRRRSRQMLDIIQQQLQHHKHRYNHNDQDEQQQQQHLAKFHATSGGGVNKKSHLSAVAAAMAIGGIGGVGVGLDEASSEAVVSHRSSLSKDVRVLYQVGDSEQDLPICAPNAVCSKIDLYETPWIERQCRCPDGGDHQSTSNIIIHHHHGVSSSGASKDLPPLDGKYRSYYEKEKFLQHKRLLIGDYHDKKFESLHLKKLMQQLGAVYEDDVHVPPMDGHENEAVLDSLEEQHSGGDDGEAIMMSHNEYPSGGARRGYAAAAATATTTTTTTGGVAAHMRHSGHQVRPSTAGASPSSPLLGGCPSGLGIDDGHTIADKTRHYKLCQPVHKLPVCKHFREFTWTLTTSAESNVTEQIVHCRCPKNSVTYLTKREPASNRANGGYKYLFACSPITRLRCQRKQPCKLFTVRKRQEFLDEVNINALCQCPKGHRCPSHHTQSGVISGESFLEDNIQTYSGYCMAND